MILILGLLLGSLLVVVDEGDCVLLTVVGSSLLTVLGKLGNWLDLTSFCVSVAEVVLCVVVGLVKGLETLNTLLGVVEEGFGVVVVWELCGRLNSFLTSSRVCCGFNVVVAVVATASNETSLGLGVVEGICLGCSPSVAA